MKFLNFFLLSWVIFALLDPDSLASLNYDPIRIRIRNTSFIQDYRARDNPRGSSGPSGGGGTLLHPAARPSSRVGQVKKHPKFRSEKVAECGSKTS
jgi:hypothetical protein